MVCLLLWNHFASKVLVSQGHQAFFVHVANIYNALFNAHSYHVAFLK